MQPSPPHLLNPVARRVAVAADLECRACSAWYDHGTSLSGRTVGSRRPRLQGFVSYALALPVRLALLCLLHANINDLAQPIRRA